MNTLRLLLCDADIRDLATAMDCVQYAWKEPNLARLLTRYPIAEVWADWVATVGHYTYL